MGNLKTWAVAAAVGILAAGSVFASPAGSAVEITDKGFSPETLEVKAGKKVVWKNSTAAELRITASPEKPAAPQDGKREKPTFESSAIKPGETFEHVFTEAGAYEVSLKSDPKVRSRVVVVAESK